MAQATISVRTLRDSPAFDFTRDVGLAARVSNVMIFDDRRTEEVWEVGALTWHAVRAHAKAQLEERLRSEHMTVADEMDPLADFLPDDPRYRIAKEVRDAGYRVASVELRRRRRNGRPQNDKMRRKRGLNGASRCCVDRLRTTSVRRTF
jgi:hypothetical protein